MPENFPQRCDERVKQGVEKSLGHQVQWQGSLPPINEASCRIN